MRIRALLLALAVAGCRITEPCNPVPSRACTWRAEYADSAGTVQITTEIWYRTCPAEQPKPPAKLVRDTTAVCREQQR